MATAGFASCLCIPRRVSKLTVSLSSRDNSNRHEGMALNRLLKKTRNPLLSKLESKNVHHQSQLQAVVIVLLSLICPQAFAQSPLRILEIQVIDHRAADAAELLKCSVAVQKAIRRTVVADTDDKNQSSESSNVTGRIIEISPELFDLEITIVVERNVSTKSPVTISQRTTKIGLATKLAFNKGLEIDCGDGIVCKLKIADIRISIPSK